jgi:hypothetical protein
MDWTQLMLADLPWLEEQIRAGDLSRTQRRH